MPRELLWSWGPELNHLGSWGTPATGWSIATSPAPPHGTYIFKAVQGDTASQPISPTGSFTPKNYVWYCQRGFRLTGTLLSTNAQIPFLALRVSGGITTDLTWFYSTASTFGIRVRVGGIVKITSSSTFATDAWHSIRVEYDGTNATLWVNGSLEGSAAVTQRPDDTLITLQKARPLDSGQEMYFRGGLLCQSDSESDRPGVAVENDRLDPDGDTAEDDALPNGGAGDPNDYQWWDDYVNGNAPDDDTTYLLFASVTERKHVSTATAHTPTDTIEGIIWHMWARAATADKFANTHARIKEGANASEVALVNLGLDTYTARTAVFDLAPDGGAWTQSDVNALEAGLRSEAANTVNVRVSALAVELISVDDDPPPVTEDRRRALIQQEI